MAQESIRTFWWGPETTAGVPAQYFRMVPCVDIKPSPKDVRFVPKEYMGTRIRERKASRVKKNTDLTIKTYAYYDLLGWMLPSLLNSSVADTITGSGTNNQQDIAFTGSDWVNGNTFSLTFDGYTTAPIAYNSTGSTLLTNVQNAVYALPSVIKAGNLTITNPSSTNIRLVCAGAWVSQNLPLTQAYILTSPVGNRVITVTNTTPGVGAYTHYWNGGTSVLPTATLVYYDGVSYKAYTNCSIDQLDFTFSVDKDIECDWKIVGNMETDQGTLAQILNTGAYNSYDISATLAASCAANATSFTTNNTSGMAAGDIMRLTNIDGTNGETILAYSVNTSTSTVTLCAAGATTPCLASSKAITAVVRSVPLPGLTLASYDEPVPPTQLSIAINGTNDTNLLGGKLTIKGNRAPLWTIKPGTDMNRATEGEFQGSFDLQFDYANYTNSYYSKYIANTAIGSIVITATDTSSNIGSAPTNPAMVWTIYNPLVTDGAIDSMKPSDVQQIKGLAGLSTTYGTNFRIDITDERKQYAPIS